MAAKYTRRINLYINGKEIKNNIRSINNEFQKAKGQIKNMTIGSKEYNAQMRKIDKLKSILNKHNQQLRTTTTAWGKMTIMAKGFLPAIGIATIVAGLGRTIRKMNEAAKAADNFDERLDNLSALTGLEGRALEELGETAKKTSVKITEGGVRIKQSADDIVDAYTKVGSQRPELLKNSEALASVTEDAIILSEAAKSELDPAVKGLTTTMNQFNLGADQSRRIINAMSAGSKEGAAGIPYLTQAVEKSGTTLNLMNVSLEENIGLIESIAPNYAKAELAGNSLDKVFLKLKEKQIGYKDGIFSVNDALDELSARYRNGESAASIFGVEHAKMGELLVQNKDEFNRYTTAVTGTNIAIEQAKKNTNNAAAIQKQARNEFHLSAIELGKNLSPAMTKLYQLAGSVASGFSKMIATSPVESLKKEHTELNTLVMKIASLNEGDKKRLELINELIRKYPKYYGEIDAATVSNNQLLTSLREVNRQMIRQIYIEGRKEELADLQKNAAEKLAVEMKYQDDLNTLKTSYFSKMGVEQQKIFTSDFSYMMQHFGKITSQYTSNTKKAIAVNKWLENNKLSKQNKGGLDYGDMIALSISYNDWLAAYKKKYKAQASAEAEYANISAYEKKWGLDDNSFEGKSNNSVVDTTGTPTGSNNSNTTKKNDSGIDSWITNSSWDKIGDEELAERKASEEKWTEFKKQQIEERTAAEVRALQIEEEIAQARVDLKDIQIDAIGQLANSMAGMFEQGSAAQIAMIAIEKAIAIAQIWMNLAREKSAINLAAAQMSTIPFVGPGLAAAYSATMTAKAVTAAGINTGLVVAQAISTGVSMGKRKKGKAYATGGFTQGETMYTAGESGTEWIAPNWMTNNPATAPIISTLESFRKNRTGLSSDAISTFADGGYTSLDSKMNTLNDRGKYRIDPFGIEGAKIDKLQNEILTELVSRIGNSLDNNTQAIQRLTSKKTYVTIEDIKKADKNYTQIENTRGL